MDFRVTRGGVEVFRQAGAEPPREAPRNEPVYVGYRNGCWIVNRFSTRDKKWETWSSPRAPAGGGVFSTGADGVALLLSNRRYAGWAFSWADHEWREIPEAGLTEGKRGSAIRRIGNYVVLWLPQSKSPHGAVCDLRTMRWTPMADAPIPIHWEPHHAVLGDKMLVWGGLVETKGGASEYKAVAGALFDPAQNVWERIPDAPVESHSSQGRAVWKGRFAIFGGLASTRGAVYDPIGKLWSPMKSADSFVGSYSSTCAANDEAAFSWGDIQGGGEACAVYEFGVGAWRFIAPPPIECVGDSMACGVGLKFYVWGGKGRGRQFLRKAAVFDLETNEWESLPDPPNDCPPDMYGE
jgi:hypothetical protein